MTSFKMQISQFLICAVFLVCGTWADPEPQSKDYLPPKHGTAPATAHHAGGRHPGGEDGPNEPANYDFSYEVQDPASSLDFGHSEKRLAEQASGSYHVLLPDGRTQIVDYEAGPDGYRPQVRYEGEAKIQASSSGLGLGRGRGGLGGGSEGYNYNAASNQQPVRQPAPKTIQSPTPKTA